MLNDLVDFKTFVAPRLVQIVYWIGIVGIVLATLGMIAGGGMMGAAMMGGGYGGGGFNIMGAVFGLIWGACALIIWRVACEVWMVIFSINDRLGQLVERGKTP